MVLQSCLQVRAQVPLFSLTSRACSDSRRRAENRCVALYKANSHTRQSFHPSWTLPPLHQSLKLLRKKSGLHRQSQGPLPCHQLPQQPNVRCLIGSSVSPQRYAAPIISVVIPVFNEVQSIGVLVERVASVLQRRGYTYEILCVDDGSTDGEYGAFLC